MLRKRAFSCLFSTVICAAVCLSLKVVASTSSIGELERSLETSTSLDLGLVKRVLEESVLAGKGVDDLVGRFTTLSADETLDDPVRAKVQLATLHFNWQFGRIDQALENADSSLELHETVGAIIAKARLLDATGREVEADEWYRRAEALTTDPTELEFIKIRRAMIQADEENINSLTELAATRDQVFKNRAAVAAALLGHVDNAIDLYVPDEESQHYYRQLVRLTDWALKVDNFDRAKELAWRAYDAATMRLDRLYALTLVLEAYRRSDTLPGLLPELAARADADPEIRLLQVDVLGETERYDEAIALYESEAVAVDDATTKNALIALNEKAGRTDELVREYERLIAEEPNQVLWYHGLARHYVNAAKPDRAKAIWQDFGAANAMTAEVLVDGARYMLKMGFEEDAHAMIAAHLASEGPSLSVFVFEFDVHHEKGDYEAAAAAIERFYATLDPADADVELVADAYERIQKFDDAIQVREAMRTARGKLSYDNRMRLAWLYSVANRKELALEEWQAIWLEVQSAARKSFAESQLLMLAAELGSLADIVIDLEEKLFNGEAGRNEVNLLVRIYIEVGDEFSAKEVVDEYARSSNIPEIEKLEQLAQIYLQLASYDKYDQTVKRLEQIDAANRIEHVQNIVLNLLSHDLATESSEKYEEIQHWLGQLRTFDEEAVSGEFEASILSMGGFDSEAIESYRRALIEQPTHSDNLLLMADLMKQNDRVDEAVALLQYVAEHASEDNEFVVAVDGIINMIGQRQFGEELDPDRKAKFRWAHRIILERIAGRDEKFYLYTLLSEIANELNDKEAEFVAIENSLATASLRRAAILRELMTMATPDAGFTFTQNEGDPQRQLTYGRRLIGLRQELPPQVFIEIGKTLLAQGDSHNARKSFELINDITGMTDVSKTTADMFFDAGFDDSALVLYQEALVTDTSNTELLLKNALLREIRGQFDVANRIYMNALERLLRSQPAVLANAPPQVDPSMPRFGPNVDTSVTRDFRTFAEVLIHGLLMTWPSEQADSDLNVTRLKALFDEQVNSVASLKGEDDDEEDSSFLRYSRLNRVALLLQRVSRATANPRLGEHFVKALLDNFPDDDYVQSLHEQEGHYWGRVVSEHEEPEEGQTVAAEETSKLEKLLIDARNEGNLQTAARIAGSLGRSDTLFDVLWEQVNEGDLGKGLQHGKQALPTEQYRQLVSVAVARLEGDEDLLLSLIGSSPELIFEIEDDVGRPLIPPDSLLHKWQAKERDARNAGSRGFRFPQSIWAYLSRHAGTGDLLAHFEFEVDYFVNSADFRNASPLEEPLDEFLRSELSADDSERLYEGLRKVCASVDGKNEYEVADVAGSLIFKLDDDFAVNKELVLRVAELWRDVSQQDFVDILDHFLNDRKKQALQDYLALNLSGPSYRLERLVSVTLAGEIAQALREIIEGEAAFDEPADARTLFRLHNELGSSLRIYGGNLPESNPLKTQELVALAELYPQEDSFALAAISHLLIDGAVVEAERRLQNYYETHKDDEFVRAAYYLQLLVSERFSEALAVNQDGGEDLNSPETLESLQSRARGSSPSGQILLQMISTRSNRFWGQSERFESLLDELRAMEESNEVANVLRNIWRGSLVENALSDRGFLTAPQFYELLSSVALNPETDAFDSYYTRRGIIEAKIRDRENTTAMTLFRDLANRVPLGNEFEQYLKAQQTGASSEATGFYLDLVDYFVVHPETANSRLEQLERLLLEGTMGDHEFTLWLLLSNAVEKELTPASYQETARRFDAIESPSDLQMIEFTRLADRVGDQDAVGDQFRVVSAALPQPEARSISGMIIIGGNPAQRRSSLNLARLVDQIVSVDEPLPRLDLLLDVLQLSDGLEFGVEAQGLYDAFVLRSLSKVFDGAELLERATILGVDTNAGTTDSTFGVPRLVELARAHAMMEDHGAALGYIDQIFAQLDEEAVDSLVLSGLSSSYQQAWEKRNRLYALQSLYGLDMYRNDYSSDVSWLQEFIAQSGRLVQGLPERWHVELLNSLVQRLQSQDTPSEMLFECTLAVILELGWNGKDETVRQVLVELADSTLANAAVDDGPFVKYLLAVMVELDVAPDADSLKQLVAKGRLTGAQKRQLFSVYRDSHEYADALEYATILDDGHGGLSFLKEVQEFSANNQDDERVLSLSERISSLNSARETLTL